MQFDRQVGRMRVVNAGSVDRKSTRLNSSHGYISYAVFCLKKKKKPSAASTDTHASRFPHLPRSPAVTRHASTFHKSCTNPPTSLHSTTTIPVQAHSSNCL